MNTTFYFTLKKVEATRHVHPDAPVLLLDDIIYIQKTLKNHSSKNIKWYKNYCTNAFNQIATERTRINGFIKYWLEKDIKTLTKFENNELSEEVDYFSEILNTTDEALAYILEHLIAYYPKEFSSKYYVDLAKKLLPFDNQILLKFIHESDRKEKTDEVYFDPDQVVSLYNSLKNFFPKQENAFKQFLKTGEVEKKKIVFHGKAIDWISTMIWLRGIKVLSAEPKNSMKNWIKRNFLFQNKLLPPKSITDNTLHKYIDKDIADPTGKMIKNILEQSPEGFKVKKEYLKLTTK